jgi:hypothetical protein
MPAPAALTQGTAACVACANSHAYTFCGTGNPVGPTCNSLLDVIVGGCGVTPLCVSAIAPTQPDVAGSGTVVPLSNGTNAKVTLPAGDLDAYSSAFTFAATRAHFTGETCTASAQCQTGQSCTSGVCK